MKFKLSKDKKITEEHNGVNQDDFQKALETMSKATGKDIYVGINRSPQSKVKFVQF